MSRRRYSLDQLAAETDVSRHAIQYWIKHRWVPLPEGRGRYRYYTPAHRDRILALKTEREKQRTLADIADYLDNPDG